MPPLTQMQDRPQHQRTKNFQHRTKTGCSVCRKRRIKCDEARPNCRRCILAGRQCPGYLDNRPFDSLAGKTAPLLLLPRIGGSEDSLDLLQLVPALIAKQGGRGVHFNGLVPFIVNRCSEYLPCRAGHNFTLDAAMGCTARGIRELLANGHSQQSDSYYYLDDPSTVLTRSYTTAVGALRYSLDDRRKSAMPEILLAALLLCCFETVKDNNEDVVQTHLYGLTKIYEHRGPPHIDASLEKVLLAGCLPLIVRSCHSRNSPCYLSQRNWSNVLIRFRDDATTTDRTKWFVDNWLLAALTTTLLADCSEFILSRSRTTSGYHNKRQKLIDQIRHIDGFCAELRDPKIKELSNNDPNATLLSLYEELSKTKEGRLDYPIHYLQFYADAMLCCYMLQVALGGHGALAAIESACAFAGWFDLFIKRLPPGEFKLSVSGAAMVKATLATSDAWREFAAEAEACAGQGILRVVEPHLFRSWLILAGIKPRA